MYICILYCFDIRPVKAYRLTKKDFCILFIQTECVCIQGFASDFETTGVSLIVQNQSVNISTIGSHSIQQKI